MLPRMEPMDMINPHGLLKFEASLTPQPFSSKHTMKSSPGSGRDAQSIAFSAVG